MSRTEREIRELLENASPRTVDFTAKLLRHLTAPEPPEPPQDEAQPGEGKDTTPSGESAQEAASAPTEAAAPEITRATTQEAPPERATLAQRLRFLFTGRN